MHEALLAEVKRIKPSALSDADILRFFDEAINKTCPDPNDYASGVYLDDVLRYYALAMISLYCGDLAEYNNYTVLYNNAAAEYSRRSFRPVEKTTQYQNMW